MVDSRPQVEDDACLVASEQAVEMLAQARGGVTEAQLAIEVEHDHAADSTVGNGHRGPSALCSDAWAASDTACTTTFIPLGECRAGAWYPDGPRGRPRPAPMRCEHAISNAMKASAQLMGAGVCI